MSLIPTTLERLERVYCEMEPGDAVEVDPRDLDVTAVRPAYQRAFAAQWAVNAAKAPTTK